MSALKKAAEDFEQQYPGAAERIKEHTYVDDLVSGADSAAEAARLVEQIDEIAGKAGFTLRKWCSNVDETLLPLADVKNAAVPIQFPDERNAIKALGIHWLPQEDAFTFKVNMKTDGPNTKHQLLSDSAKLFDPIGWLAPVTVRAKILFQQCWLYDMNWHDPLPAAVEQMWIEFKENLPRLEQVKIPRWMSSYNGHVELHGFSDASEEAYSAVVYIRTFNEIDSAYVNLVAAKTKVAPIRQVSLPRLELNGAWLLVRLMKRVAKAFERFKVEIFAYTDSTIVLHQLAIHPRKLDTYVANRTASILEVLPRSRWFHVKSEENPADCASRGISPAELVNHPLWWFGPPWLKAHASTWKHEMPDEEFDEATLEVRKKFRTFNIVVRLPKTTYEEEKQILEKRSSLLGACRQLSRVNRFLYNLRPANKEKRSGWIVPAELHSARMQFVRLAQHDVFQKEIKTLAAGREVSPKSKIATIGRRWNAPNWRSFAAVVPTVRGQAPGDSSQGSSIYEAAGGGAPLAELPRRTVALDCYGQPTLLDSRLPIGNQAGDSQLCEVPSSEGQDGAAADGQPPCSSSHGVPAIHSRGGGLRRAHTSTLQQHPRNTLYEGVHRRVCVPLNQGRTPGGGQRPHVAGIHFRTQEDDRTSRLLLRNLVGQRH